MGMMTFMEFLEDKRVNMFGLGNRSKDTSRTPKRRLGVLFKAVNPADLGMSVVWNMKARPFGSKSKKSGVLGK